MIYNVWFLPGTEECSVNQTCLGLSTRVSVCWVLSQRQVGTAWRPWHRTCPPLSSFPFWRNNSRVRLALGVISLTHIPLCSFHTLRRQLLWVPHSPGQRKRPGLGQSLTRVHSQGWEDKQGGVSPKLISFITSSHVGTPLPHTSWRGLKLVLALEDVDKPTCKADRELSQARREAAGLVSVLLGEMRNSGDPAPLETWANVRNRTYPRKTFVQPSHFMLSFCSSNSATISSVGTENAKWET